MIATPLITIEKIERETDKAFRVMVEVESAAGRKGVWIWLPKSQVEIDGDKAAVPAWLQQAKLRDMFGDRAGQFWFN